MDTAAKRFSAINPAAPWRGGGLLPDGTVSAADRKGPVGLYIGIVAAVSYTLTALAGSFAWTGYDATLTPTVNINTAAKRFSAINIGNPWRGINTIPTGSIGRTARISIGGYYSGLGQQYTYTIECLTTSYFMDAEPAFSDFEIAATTAAFAMTGNSATLLATRTLYATTATFAMTGNDANLSHFTERTLVATTGAFAMTGNSVTFDRPRTLTALAGDFSSSAADIRLDWSNAPVVRHTRPGGLRRNYIVKGKKYFNITNEELAYLLAQGADVTREDVKVIYKDKKARQIGKEVFESVKPARKYDESDEIAALIALL
jgi:hypothetical protein